MRSVCSPAVSVRRPSSHPRLTMSPAGFQDVQSPDEAGSAYRTNFPRATRNSFELFSEPRSVLPNRLEQRRVGEAVQHVRGDRGYEGTAAKRGSVIPRLDCRGDVIRYENGTHWESASQGLGEGEHVGNDAASLVREQMARSAESALDLVEDERDLPLGGESSQFFEKSVVEDSHSSLALHRLDDQRRDCFLVERGLEVGQVALAN